jgi:hypothetical protein
LRSIIVPSIVAGAIALGAGGGSSSSLATATPSEATGAIAPATSATTGTTARLIASAAAANSVAKVNANTASQGEITQALAAAGVPNAARWAREVVEYRPYPTDDPTFAKLRQNLAKYNPPAGVVDQIISVLTLS